MRKKGTGGGGGGVVGWVGGGEEEEKRKRKRRRRRRTTRVPLPRSFAHACVFLIANTAAVSSIGGILRLLVC
jgi:hypothetical protein